MFFTFIPFISFSIFSSIQKTASSLRYLLYLSLPYIINDKLLNKQLPSFFALFTFKLFCFKKSTKYIFFFFSTIFCSISFLFVLLSIFFFLSSIFLYLYPLLSPSSLSV